MALIGEGTANEQRVSLQLLQNIYHELTGKNEDLSRSYNEGVQIKLEDFIQLNLRLQQHCEQYNIKASNCSVKIYFINDTTETFSSFDRFLAFNAGSNRPVESVLLTYNFMVVLPKLEKAQPYTINIRVASKIAIEKKMRDDMSFSIPRVLRIMGMRTAVVDVKYIDYVVARNLMTAVEDWFESLARPKTTKFWKFVRRHSGYIPLITKYIAGISSVVMLAYMTPQFLAPASTPVDLAQFLLLAFFTVFTSYRIAMHLGDMAESSVDEWSELSYVALTSGDTKAIADAEARNSRTFIWATVRLIGSIVVPVATRVSIFLLTGK